MSTTNGQTAPHPEVKVLTPDELLAIKGGSGSQSPPTLPADLVGHEDIIIE